MGRVVILPLRVTVEIPDIEGEPITLPPITIPPLPPTPPPGVPPVVAVPAPAETVNILELQAQMPRDAANTPSPANAYKTSITFHWLGDSGPASDADDLEIDELEGVARFHIGKDWGGGFGGSGIMYHEAILRSGLVVYLREYTEVVWHAGVEEANLHSRAILVMCSRQRPPTAAQLAIVRRRISDFGVPPRGHREWSSTECPGEQIMEVIQASR